MLGFKAGATVSIEETVKAFENVFGRGGRFGNSTDELAKTFEGTLSMIGDKIFNFKKVLLEAGFFDELKFQFGSLDKFLSKNAKQLDQIATSVGKNLAQGMVKVVQIGKDLIPTLKGIGRILKSIGDGFMALPPFIQQSGIIGAFLFGKKGLVALASVSLFVDKVQDLIKESKIRMGIFDIENIDSVDAKIKSIKQQINELENSTFALNFENEGLDTSIEDKKILKLEEELQILLEHRKTLKNLNKVQLESNHHLFEMSNGAIEVAKNMETVTKFTSMSNHHLFEMANNVEKTKGAFEGFKEGLQGSLDVTTFDRFKEAGENSMKSLKKSLTDFVMTGKMSFETLKIAIIRSLVEALIGSVVTSAIKKSTALFKFQAIREGLISAYKAGAKALASVPFPLNIAVAGAVIGTGIGMVNKIKGFQSGGAVSKGQPIMVGEQGAELFIPNSSGQITQSARGTGNEETNVNFTINATDVRGVKELLIDNRATIVNVINSALNEKGKEALV